MKKLAIIFLSLLLIPANASAKNTDFSGCWQLDDKLSKSMEPVFLLQGLGWFKRKIGEGLDKNQCINQDEKGLTIQFDNFLGKFKQELFFDGKAHETLNPAGKKTMFSTSWQEEGKILLSEGPVEDENGSRGILTEIRELSPDQNRLILKLKASTSDGRKAETLRVFYRKIKN